MGLGLPQNLAAHYQTHCLRPRDHNWLLLDLQVERRSLTTLHCHTIEPDPVPVPVVKSYIKRPSAYASYSVETFRIGHRSDLGERGCSANYKNPDTETRPATLIGDGPLNGAQSRARWRRCPVGAAGHHQHRCQADWWYQPNLQCLVLILKYQGPGRCSDRGASTEAGTKLGCWRRCQLLPSITTETYSAPTGR